MVNQHSPTVALIKEHLLAVQCSTHITLAVVVFQPLLAIVLCCVALANGETGNKFSYEDGILDVRCPQHDNAMNPVLLAIPNDCSKFQKCFNGRAFTISCPPGQEFGLQLQRCDYPVFARCQQGYVQPQPAGFSYDLGQVDTRCPRFDDPFKPTHLAHPSDCKRFFKCFDGRAFELECPRGQEWGVKLNRCDFPSMARCAIERVDKPSQVVADPKEVVAETDPKEAAVAGSGKAKEEAVEYVKPAKAAFSYNAGVNDVRCPKFDDPFRPIHLAHPTDCRKFMKCFDGRAYTIDCPIGQEFGIRINRCDYPQFAQCSLQKDRKSLRKAAAPQNDEYYYDDYYDDERIPLDSTEWTPEQREMIEGIKDGRCPPTDDPADPIHFIHPKDCGKFYKCYDGRAYLILCPAGQHWSVRYDRCDYPKVAKCTIRGN
ncbi:chondroitin proteoglycan 2-like [Anopheles marshallii]|uniref:chondroitin proteoglycan 2-like n=1 Tax=Anopheles marshallii TaxID=1521116 RepID=UPI00237AC610|nr:chondroitin proteoglycan 2-like [Anopheles marshallii]